MISEPTASVNLLSELADYFAMAGAGRTFALLPDAAEPLPYDTSVMLRGRGLLVQFKRAHPTANGYRYRLNDDSSLHDQHLRLLHLERSGCAVYYALPMFHMTPQLVSGRSSLRLMTAWFRPTQLVPEQGPVGIFDVQCDTADNTWRAGRGRSKFIEAPMSFPELAEDFSRRGARHNIEILLNKVNDIVHNGIAPEGNSYIIAENMQLKAVPPAPKGFLRGQAVLCLVPEDGDGQQPQSRPAARKPAQKGQPS